MADFFTHLPFKPGKYNFISQSLLNLVNCMRYLLSLSKFLMSVARPAPAGPRARAPETCGGDWTIFTGTRVLKIK